MFVILYNRRKFKDAHELFWRKHAYLRLMPIIKIDFRLCIVAKYIYISLHNFVLHWFCEMANYNIIGTKIN